MNDYSFVPGDKVIAVDVLGAGHYYDYRTGERKHLSQGDILTVSKVGARGQKGPMLILKEISSTASTAWYYAERFQKVQPINNTEPWEKGQKVVCIQLPHILSLYIHEITIGQVYTIVSDNTDSDFLLEGVQHSWLKSQFSWFIDPKKDEAEKKEPLKIESEPTFNTFITVLNRETSETLVAAMNEKFGPFFYDVIEKDGRYSILGKKSCMTVPILCRAYVEGFVAALP